MNALDLLYLPAAALTAPWWARKARGGWRERFGHTPPLPPRPPATPRLLIHAVSVGEVNTLRALVPMLRDDGLEVVVASTTDTGLDRARALFGATPGVHVVRYALDLSSSVRRFLDAVDPDAAALVELEVWPNFLRECRRRSVPVCIINGRLSARSFRGYSRFRRFLAPSFRSLDFAAVQDADYASRFEHMGVRDVRITGSMKWDAVTPIRPGEVLPGADELAAAMGIDRARPLIVAGSTGPGPTPRDPSEEQILHEACPPGVQLLCAPRKPERFDEAFAHLGSAARCVRRSTSASRSEGSAGAQAPDAPGTRDRFLLDSIGELRLAYSLASIAVIGRTFTNLKGSDPIEPIALGKPTIVGPDTANFTSIVETFRSAGAIVTTTADQLRSTIESLLSDPARCAQLAECGLACIAAQQGATAAHARLLGPWARAARSHR